MMVQHSSSAFGARSNALWGRSGKLRAAVLSVFLTALALAASAGTAASGTRAGKAPAHDTTPPETTITRGPASGATAFGSVTFTFTASEAATFQCSVDNAAFRPCSSSSSDVVTVPAGPHTFRVRAVDTSGNVDRTPAAATWLEGYGSGRAYPAGSVLAKAQAAPLEVFAVIVTTRTSSQARTIEAATHATTTAAGRDHFGSTFSSINGFPARLPGWALLWLADHYDGVSIVPDERVKDPLPPERFSPVQSWQATLGADRLWGVVAKAPTIAVIDSGIDGSKAADFGARVLAHVTFGQPPAKADDYGHGTFVASIAAGAAASYPGVAPTANLVDVRVIGGDGSGSTSDVIAGVDWVLKHRDDYGIKVVNLSLQSAKAGSFKFDPLDRAVEQLWLHGITVVTSVGNAGAGTAQRLAFAPANDPFVVTVGAADDQGTAATGDDTVAPWSQFGYTADGFAEPTLVAPGRRMIGAVPAGSSLPLTLPDRVVASGYMRLSGTSVAAAAVSGAAAQLLALHPSWGPDQVKGALMLTAHALSGVAGSVGVGEANVVASALVRTPPNPNLGLDRFVHGSSDGGGPSFDAASWSEAARTDPRWNLASFADASWSEASWGEASWADASWAESAFVSASWADATQADAVLADASWGD